MRAPARVGRDLRDAPTVSRPCSTLIVWHGLTRSAGEMISWVVLCSRGRLLLVL
ncbi:hypothetical protein J2W54_004735 [Rhodococcus fascians]|nr:hypothetical protein [Rhodococcus sp. 3258]MDR6934321.1 hypothetical protein [Rhodococcus fascians]